MAASLEPAHVVRVSEGTANAHAEFACPVQGAITIGTTSVSYVRRNMYNVQEFGAVGDGSTNNYDAITAAIAAIPSTGERVSKRAIRV